MRCLAQIAASSAIGWMTPVSLLREHCRDELCFGPQQGVEFVDANHSVAIDAEAVDRPALGRQVVGEGGDAGVLDGGDDDAAGLGPGPLKPPRLAEEGPDGEVVGFGAAAGENDAVGVAARHICADEFADPLAGLFKYCAAPGGRIRAGWPD